MKRIIVVGLGNFGSVLAARLHETGHEVVAIDTRTDVVDAMGGKVTRAVAADATQRRVLEQLGAADADAAVISTGGNLSASVLSLLALRDVGVKNVYVKVGSNDHARIVDALGAADSIFPERESALGLASRLATGKLLQYVQLGPDLGVQEMPVPESWMGKTLRDLGLPARYRVQVVAVHDALTDEMSVVPAADRKLVPSDSLLVAGHPEALQRLSRVT